nr:hypothetical protein [Tanacetum cinerariifolium]
MVRYAVKLPYLSTILQRFKIDKKKRIKLTLEVFRCIFQIFPRIEDQDFDALPSEEDTVSFLREPSHTGVINSLNDVVIDQMHQPWRTFTALINRSLSRKTTALDKLRLSRVHILWGMYYQKNVDYVELLWEYFIYQIDNRGYKNQEKMYHPRFTKVIIHHFLIQDKTLSWRNKIGMHTLKDDYLINTLRFVSRKEASLKYGVVLPECLTSPQMKESKAYKTYLGYATGTVPPKVARKFNKASPSKKDSMPVPADEEPIQKGKRVKRSAKKSSTTPTTGIIIREPLVETQSKRKVKVDVARGKGIDLLSEVALTEEAQMKKVRKKSLRDFQKSHPSGSGLVAEKPPSVKKITPPVTKSCRNDEDDSNDENNSNEDKDEENKSDDNEPPSNSEKDDDEDDDNDNDKSEGDEDRGMDNIPPADVEIVSPLDVHVHHEVPKIYISTLLAVPVSVILEASLVYTNIPQSLQTFTSPPLQSTPSPLPTIETTNIPPSILDFASVFRFNDEVIALEKDVVKLKNDPLHTQVTAITNQLPQILPDEVSNFALPVIEKMIQELLDQVNLAKASSQPQSTYEAAATLTEFELKKILIDKMNSNESYLTAPKHRECYDGLVKSYNLDKDLFSSYDVYSLKRSRDDKDKMKALPLDQTEGTKSQPKSSRKSVHAEEPEFEVRDTDTPQGQEGNQGNDNVEPKTESASRRDWFTKPSRSQEHIDPDWNEGKTPQKGPTQNWLKTLAAFTSTAQPVLSLFRRTMTTKAQQSALDNTLIAPENQRVIGKCNMRINRGMKPKESTYKVVLDALALTTCYHAFLITAEVPVIYMP